MKIPATSEKWLEVDDDAEGHFSMAYAEAPSEEGVPKEFGGDVAEIPSGDSNSKRKGRFGIFSV